MKVRFLELLPGQHGLRLLAKQTPVARFEVDDGEAQVLAGDVHPFKDLSFLLWSSPLREIMLTALFAGIEEADWADRQARTLNLAGRFVVESNRDVRPWRVLGFTHLQTCDLKIIKHVLGVGSEEPEASVAWWARTLGQSIEPREFLDALEAVGCVEWKRLEDDRDAESDVPIRLYQSLSSRAQAECVRILAPLRESFQRAVYAAIRHTAFEREARHVHLRTSGEEWMYFLDDRGLLVVTRGPAEALSCVTAFDAHVAGEQWLGERTLTRWWNKILQKERRPTFEARYSTLFHTPENWRSPTRAGGSEKP